MAYAFGTLYLALVTVFFLLTAWSAARKPTHFAGSLGFAIANPGGLNEIRAQYAGFFLVAGLFSAASLAGLGSRHTAFTVLAIIFGGLILGRIAGFIANRGAGGFCPVIRALHVIDAAGFLAAAYALSATAA